LKKILIIFGTRPEAIKMAPLINFLKTSKTKFKYKICVTAQHRKMLDQVLQLFQIVPDYDLDIMNKGQDLYDITSKVVIGLRDIINIDKPDLILVHGDTTTSMVASLASFYARIPVGHVEAGLRTYLKYNPWPEELNRQITGRLATYHFSPTLQSKQNLLNEGVKKENIIVTGNTVIDALFIVLEKINNSKSITNNLYKSLNEDGLSSKVVSNWINNNRRLVLVTGHRRENFGEGFINICKSIKYLSKKYQDVDFVYPMHLNPNVRKAIKNVFGNIDSINKYFNNIFFIEPLEYLPFVFLMSKSYFILTDSGGIQEEAPSIGKPVLVMRDTTERPEAIQSGTVKLVGTNFDKITKESSKLIEDNTYYNSISIKENPYGDGHASSRIIKFLTEIFS